MGRTWCYACIVGFLALLAGFMLAACGDSLGDAYLASNADTVIFLQCTETDGLVSGSMTAASLDSDAGEVESSTVTLTGTVSGSDVNLTLSQPLGITSSVTGTISGEDLRLNIPQDDGSFVQVDLMPATVSDCNEAVAVLEAQAAQATNEQAADDAASILASDVEAVSLALSTLQDDAGYLPECVAYVSDALTMTEEDVRAGVEAGQVEMDVGSVEVAQGSVEVAVNSVDEDIGSLQSAMDQLERDFEAFQAAQAESPDYVADGVPTEDDIQEQRDAVWSAIEDAQQAMDDYLAQGEQMVAEARSYVE